MQPYEYPRVPRSSKIQSSSDRLQINSRDDNRFSWVQSPAELDGHRWQRDTRRTSELPPLPQIPDHLNSAIEDQTQIGNQVVVENHRQDQVVQNESGVRVTDEDQPQSTEHRLQQDPTLLFPKQERHERRKTPKPMLNLNHDMKHQIRIEPDENPLSPISPVAYLSGNVPKMNYAAPTADTNHYPHEMQQSTQGGSWHHSFCSCAEPTICMTSLFCPCVTHGKTQYRLNMRAEKKEPTNVLGYSVINGSCLAFGILCGINGILAAIQHTRLRKTYDMEGTAGNVFSDCVRGFCCCCCTVAQDEKEVKFREQMARSDASAFSNAGYVTPTGMVFAAPPR